MEKQDEIYVQLAKDFIIALELSCNENRSLKICNEPNEKLVNHEREYKNHIKIDWLNSTSKHIKFL
jgi:hypothetical protein